MILVWLRLGSSDSGGAFQSGAVLAGALILLRSAGVLLDRLTGRWLRPLLIVGMIGFILTGALIVSLGNARLGWSPEWSFAAMLTVEIALTAGIVRVVDDVYGIHVASELGVLTPLLIVACLTILYGPYQALRQEDLKKRLAYSTVSHVSYVMVGISLVTPAGPTRGVVHQGLMKIALFFCAGLFAEALGITKLSQMHGLGRRTRMLPLRRPGTARLRGPKPAPRGPRAVRRHRPRTAPRWRRTAAPRRPAAARPRSPVRPS